MTHQPQSLSIRLSTDGLSFCSFTPEEPQPLAYEEHAVRPVVSMAANLKEALVTQPLLRQDYQRVNVLVCTPQFTVMPSEGFERKQGEQAFRFLFPQQAGTYVTFNLLRRSGVAIVFGFDKNIHQLLLDDFPRARFYASASPLTELFGERSICPGGKRLYAYIHESAIARRIGLQPREMSVYAFDQGRPLLINSYNVGGEDDCLYFLLGVWQQLGFDQCDDTLCLVDEGTISRPLAERLKRYVQHVRLLDKGEDFGATLTQGQAPAAGTPSPLAAIPYDLQALLAGGF